jgi:hypothetical protein
MSSQSTTFDPMTRRNASKAARLQMSKRHGWRSSCISKVTTTLCAGTRPWAIRVLRTFSELTIKERRQEKTLVKGQEGHDR